MQEKIYINFFKTLFYLIPVGLISGPFIPDLAVSLMALLFIALSIKENLWKEYYDNNVIKFLFFLNLYLVVISLFSENILLSLKSSLFYFRFLIFSIAVWYLLNRTDKSFKKNYTIYLFLIFIILSLDAVYQYSFGKNIIGLEMVQPDRVSSFFGEQMVLGSYQVRLLFLLVGIIITFKIFKKHLISLSILFLITFISILLSGERTSFGLLVISILILTFVDNFSTKFLIPIFVSFFLIMFIAYLDKDIRYRNFIEPLHQSNLASKELLDNYKFQKKGYVHENNKILIFSKEHTAHYHTAFKIFLDNPIIGVGPKMFRVKCSEKKYNSGINSCTTHPHNILLQILSETGAIGFIFYLIMIIFVIKELFKIYRIKHFDIDYIQLGCLILFFGNLFPLFPSGNIFNNWLSIIFYFPLGFYLYSSSIDKLKT